MSDALKLFEIAEPVLIRRHNGGYLAKSPCYARVKIAVSGRTKDKARERFECAYKEWLRTLG